MGLIYSSPNEKNAPMLNISAQVRVVCLPMVVAHTRRDLSSKKRAIHGKVLGSLHYRFQVGLLQEST